MKNTQTASIGGIVFHIEEDAHLKLSTYLSGISSSLQGSEGYREIMNDIEARIAEILEPKVKGFKQVVTIDDVEEVIRIMGNPQEFGEGNAASAAPPQPQASKEYVRKRVFRDADDKVLFGVCSGLGHYFGIDPFWIRLGWALSVFIFGFGVLLYLILAIIMPKAVTAGEKLEMHGEPADINNIRRRVEEEMDYLKKKMNNLKDEFQNKQGGARSSFGKRFTDLFVSLGSGAGNAAVTVIKGVFAFAGFVIIFICSVILIGLLVTLFSGVNVIHIHAANGHWVHYEIHDIFSFFALAGMAKNVVIAGIVLFIGVPLLGIIIRIARSLFGNRNNSKGVYVALGVLWIISFLLIIGGSVSAFGHFSVTGSAKDQVSFYNHANTLYVTMPPAGDENLSVRIDSLNFYITDDNVFRGNPSFCVEQSPDSLFHFITIKYARGITAAEAETAAGNINYSFSQHDSVLSLNSIFELEPGSPWRKQKIELMLQVPVNKSIALPEGIDNIMCATVHGRQRHVGGKKWTMGANGELKAEME